jgi:hypothetical protein
LQLNNKLPDQETHFGGCRPGRGFAEARCSQSSRFVFAAPASTENQGKTYKNHFHHLQREKFNIRYWYLLLRTLVHYLRDVSFLSPTPPPQKKK